MFTLSYEKILQVYSLDSVSSGNRPASGFLPWALGTIDVFSVGDDGSLA